MISYAYDRAPAGQQYARVTVQDERTRTTLTLFSMASLLACAFSAASAIELGSSTRPFTLDKAAREAFGHIEPLRTELADRPAPDPRTECQFESCRSMGGPIMRIAIPPANRPQSTQAPGVERPIVATPQPSVATFNPFFTADDDTVLPPLPSTGYGVEPPRADVAPLPAPERRAGLPRYTEVMAADASAFPFPGPALDKAVEPVSAHATVALEPSPPTGVASSPWRLTGPRSVE
jgi:hypothetical protein